MVQRGDVREKIRGERALKMTWMTLLPVQWDDIKVTFHLTLEKCDISVKCIFVEQIPWLYCLAFYVSKKRDYLYKFL